jgi:hypothetical protein
MSKNNVIELAGRDESQDPLTELLRTGAQQLIQQAVEAELQSLLAQHTEKRGYTDESVYLAVSSRICCLNNMSGFKDTL